MPVPQVLGSVISETLQVVVSIRMVDLPGFVSPPQLLETGRNHVQRQQHAPTTPREEELPHAGCAVPHPDQRSTTLPILHCQRPVLQRRILHLLGTLQLVHPTQFLYFDVAKLKHHLVVRFDEYRPFVLVSPPKPSLPQHRVEAVTDDSVGSPSKLLVARSGDQPRPESSRLLQSSGRSTDLRAPDAMEDLPPRHRREMLQRATQHLVS